MGRRDSVAIQGEHDVVLVRQTVRRLAQEVGFGIVDQTKLVTAASELARNTLVYGGGGAMTWEIDDSGPRHGLRLVFEDHGPGIPDLDLAMQDGWTSGGGLGMGLPGTRRLVHEFSITSAPGQGTRVAVARWK